MPTLLLVDAYSQIYRAFYAIRTLTAPDGRPVNAIFGFTKMLRKQLADSQPTHVAVVYDLGAPAARLEVLPSYKESRPPTPPDLDDQLPNIREILQALGIPIVEREGEEADDVIATLATQATSDGCHVLIATSDKDLAQLVDAQVNLLRPDGKQTALIDAAQVKERYGIRPDQVVDYLSMVGDNVDDIPGIPGVGPKTAASLLGQFGTFDAVLDQVAEIPRPKLRAAIVEHADRVRRNRKLVALRKNLDLSVEWRELTPSEPNQAKLREIYRELGFKSLLEELDPPAAQTGDLFSGTL